MREINVELLLSCPCFEYALGCFTEKNIYNMHFICSVEEMCSYLARGKCNSFLPVEQPQNFFLCQKIILRIVYSILCVYLLVLEVSENKDDS